MTRVASAAALCLVLGSCAGGEETTPESSPSEPATSEEPSAGESATPTGSPTDDEGEQPATTWRPVPGSVDRQVTVSGAWRLALLPGGGAAELSGPKGVRVDAPPGHRITDTLLDGDHAVVVAEHERAESPNVATIIDLGSGKQATLDGESRVPTTVGGTWALGAGLLVHATTSGRDYCLAVVDLTTDRATRGPCVPPRHGITNARVTPGGVTAMTFDDSRPSCRTLNRVEGGEFVPLRGVTECRGWEAVGTETSATWGEVADERRIDTSRFHVDAGEGVQKLGPGTTGTLTWCGSAAYFVRDPQRDSQPARLLRVEPDGGTTVVYETTATGKAFLSAPRCGGSDLTITAFSSAGDEQVTTPVR